MGINKLESDNGNGKWKSYAFIDPPGRSDIKLNIELSGEMISHQNAQMLIYSKHVAH